MTTGPRSTIGETLPATKAEGATAPRGDTLELEVAVSYRDVDREEVLQLPAVFRFLQEAAIAHANRHDVGTHAAAERGESWMLNRIAVAIHRYPRYEETLRIETWSSGIKGFKGYRDFRVRDAGGALVVAGSSLWLYVDVRARAIVRVPREVAERFPARPEGVFCPELESLVLPAPAAGTPAEEITVRYGDIDSNLHVNNTAYLDYLQTALARTGRPPRPREVRLKFGKGIPAGTGAVRVRFGPPATDGAAFSIEHADTIAAQGDVRG